MDLHRKRRERILELIAKQDARPGIRSLIAEAIAIDLPIGVASSSHHQWVDGYLSKLGLFESFRVIVCADDVVHAKPFPDLYLLACSKLGVSPEDAVALEDSPNGIAAAKAAGVFVIAYPNSVTTLLDLSEADHRMDSLAGVSLADLSALQKD